jgi:cytochrome c2
VGQKLSFETLTAWPNEVPSAGSDELSHGMPRYALKPAERQSLAAFLAANASPLSDAASGKIDVPDLERGAALIEQARCANCHSLPGGLSDSRPRQTNIGPSLERIGERVNSEWIAAYLEQPGHFYPGTRMPQYKFSAQERSTIAAWLIDKSSNAASAQKDAGAVKGGAASGNYEQGRALFSSQGCIACHEHSAAAPVASRIGPSLVNSGTKSLASLPPAAAAEMIAGDDAMTSLLDYYQALLDDPQRYGIGGEGSGRMPRYFLDAKERQAIAFALAAEVQELPPESFIKDLSQPSKLLAAHVSADELFADPLQSAYWPWPIKAQGSGAPRAAGNDPNSKTDTHWLSIAERNLEPEACAACHPQQHQQWQQSRHAKGMSPGITGQLIDWVETKPGEMYDCLRCHARISEQLLLRPSRSYKDSSQAAGPKWEHNPHFHSELQSAAHGCVNCHVRAHVRHAPDPGRTKYLWEEQSLTRHELEREAWLRDSRLCAVCHQFPSSQEIADGGPPLQNTYEEWRSWATVQSKPQSCQDCHMKDGDHRFLGIHDSEFVRAAVDVKTAHAVVGGRMQASIEVLNLRNGHHLPTYVTPRIWLHGYFSAADGGKIEGSFQDDFIGRDARAKTQDGRTEWNDVKDTRIPAGGSYVFRYEAAVPEGARRFHLEVFVEPDHFYHQSYSSWVKEESRSAAGRALLGQALAETAPFTSGYFLLQESYALP